MSQKTDVFLTTAERTSNLTTRGQFEDLILDGRKGNKETRCKDLDWIHVG
jgi:hypothetical protein